MASFIMLLIGAALVGGLVWVRGRFMSFGAQSPDEYEGLGPEFDLPTYLNGPMVCEGVIYGPTGRVASRFTVEMEGIWSGTSGRLVETFHYDSGAVQNREWKLELGENGEFEARGEDILGTGRGQQCGPTVRLAYRIRLPDDAGGHVLDTVDWMYLLENGSIMNRSQFRKYGFKVAELVATMRRKDVA
ncbi:DUF3833 family protein [Mesobaculum littorinae]|uniref:DUF3833 family protein n=1 Tax=Mesobaculum littorinae TaxID=2486419 RepID=A0A438AHI6_9RHOB|nr:DUF3833 family protein [Mesobaculum littorinae]RVV98191.1 DUF3833 family protein [Mesobaculum littorinae]